VGAREGFVGLPLALSGLRSATESRLISFTAAAMRGLKTCADWPRTPPKSACGCTQMPSRRPQMAPGPTFCRRP